MAIPNMKSKYEESSLVDPKRFLKYAKKLGYRKIKPPKGVIFCYDNKLFDHIIGKHEVEKVGGYEGEFYLLKETRGQVGVIGRFGFGAPVVSAAMEEIIALGVKEFLSIGVAGSLQENLKLGSVVVCNKAIRDEGTSYHYIKPSKYAHASKNMLRRIEETLDKVGLKYFVGAAWTTDAPYRETASEAKKYRKEGVLAVEMEASAIFAVAEYRKVEAGAIFTISDFLSESTWEPKFHLMIHHLEKLFQVAKEVLMSK